MNQEVGSIMSFMHKVFPVKVYDKDVPQGFKRPSLYFPPPKSFDSNDTLSTYMKTYSLNVKLFHEDSQQANKEAERIADAFRKKRSIIPLVEADGTKTGDHMRIGRIETRISDRGVAVILVQWDSRYHYEREEADSLGYVDFQSGVK